MQYISEFCIAAAMGTGVLFALYFMKRNYKTLHNRLFFCMILINFLSSVLNVVSISTITDPARYSAFVRLSVNLGYLWLYNLLAGSFLLYTDNLTRIPQLKIPVRAFVLSVHLLETVLICTSPLTNWIAYFDGDLVYHRGILHPLLYAVSYTELLCSMILFAVRRKQFNHYQKISVFWFALLNYATQIFQILYPRYVISNFVNTMSLFVLFVAFENQAYYLFRSTQCYNRHSFVTQIRWLQKRKMPYQVTAMRMDYIQTSSVAARPSMIDQLTVLMAERVYRAFPGEVYVLSNEIFAVIRESASRRWDADMADKARACFADPFPVLRENRKEAIRISPLIQTITVTDHFPNGFAFLDCLSEAETFSRPALSGRDVEAAAGPAGPGVPGDPGGGGDLPERRADGMAGMCERLYGLQRRGGGSRGICAGQHGKGRGVYYGDAASEPGAEHRRADGGMRPGSLAVLARV